MVKPVFYLDPHAHPTSFMLVFYVFSQPTPRRWMDRSQNKINYPHLPRSLAQVHIRHCFRVRSPQYNVPVREACNDCSVPHLVLFRWMTLDSFLCKWSVFVKAGQARDEDTSRVTHSGSLTEQLIAINPVTFHGTYRPVRPTVSQHSRSLYRIYRYAFGRTPLTEDRLVPKPLTTRLTRYKMADIRLASKPRVGCDPDRSKTLYALFIFLQWDATTSLWHWSR